MSKQINGIDLLSNEHLYLWFTNRKNISIYIVFGRNRPIRLIDGSDEMNRYD